MKYPQTYVLKITSERWPPSSLCSFASVSGNCHTCILTGSHQLRNLVNNGLSLVTELSSDISGTRLSELTDHILNCNLFSRLMT